MKNKIDHPKVFISYAWGTEEHDEKVIALVTSLKVNIELDKFVTRNLKETLVFELY